MNVKVIIFDLDDTLYDEITFVESGFMHVSEYFSKNNNIPKNEFYNKLNYNINKNGRGKVFDTTLKQYKIFSKTNVKKAIMLYRTHSPNIKLREDAVKIIEYLSNLKYPLYIVTDGNKIVQKKKVEALQLNSFFKKILITHNYGKHRAKPSSYCFKKIAKIEKEEYKNIVYIADNINKDFVNIKKLGFKTIRLRNGMFKNIKKTQEYNAHIELDSLLELKKIIK